jgi:recombination protein RecA
MSDKKKINLAMASIEKQFGKGAIMRLGDTDQNDMAVEVISTGSMALDHALGRGGMPRGRIVEIYGPESSGKTTMALHLIAEAQKQGGTCAFVDAEHALDIVYAAGLGVNVDELLLSQPDCGEQGLEIADQLVHTEEISVVVVDSVAALVPRAELEGEMGASHVGLQARLMSQALRKLTAAVSRSKTIVVFINQMRKKIGVMFGSPETTTGGEALKFYASVRLDVRRIGQVKDKSAEKAAKEDDDKKSGISSSMGNRTRVKVVKNKVAPPFREAEFDVIFGTGIDRIGELVDLGAATGIIEKSGAWYALRGERIGQGRDNAKAFFLDKPEIADALREEVQKALNVGKFTKLTTE